ncbi:hypothetical protein NVP2275O_059 [Vibrio phage 2.275.O._10N.286.54.E11]|nr:hypothetical protein NVP2275O_059 [Vibrio phage 2.275.O._10N.286.54.E11]
MSTAQKLDLKEIDLVPTDAVKARLATLDGDADQTFLQQLTKGRALPIKQQTFKALLVAAAKSVEFAQKEGSDLAKARSQQNYDYYFDQINMEDGDALTMFMYSHNDWEL